MLVISISHALSVSACILVRRLPGNQPSSPYSAAYGCSERNGLLYDDEETVLELVLSMLNMRVSKATHTLECGRNKSELARDLLVNKRYDMFFRFLLKAVIHAVEEGESQSVKPGAVNNPTCELNAHGMKKFVDAIKEVNDAVVLLPESSDACLKDDYAKFKELVIYQCKCLEVALRYLCPLSSDILPNHTELEKEAFVIAELGMCIQSVCDRFHMWPLPFRTKYSQFFNLGSLKFTKGEVFCIFDSFGSLFPCTHDGVEQFVRPNMADFPEEERAAVSLFWKQRLQFSSLFFSYVDEVGNEMREVLFLLYHVLSTECDWKQGKQPCVAINLNVLSCWKDVNPGPEKQAVFDACRNNDQSSLLACTFAPIWPKDKAYVKLNVICAVISFKLESDALAKLNDLTSNEPPEGCAFYVHEENTEEQRVELLSSLRTEFDASLAHELFLLLLVKWFRSTM